MSCRGVTRAGQRCTLTASSALKEAEPLRKGSDFCLFHSRPFAAHPCLGECPQALEIIFLDLETTGVSVVEDRIVELAAVQILPSNLPGFSFSTTVFVETDILEKRSQEAAQVHGIGQLEIAVSPTFPEVWKAFMHFLGSLSNSYIQESASDTDDDPSELPMIADIHRGMDAPQMDARGKGRNRSPSAMAPPLSKHCLPSECTSDPHASHRGTTSRLHAWAKN